MFRTNVYLTEEQEKGLRMRAAIAKKPKAEILRDFIDLGLKSASVQKSTSTEAFLKLAKIADQFRNKGTAPENLSANIDKYTWDE